MVYRIAAEGVIDDDKAFLADVRREVQRERDVRRLRRLATLLPYRGGEALPVVRKASGDDQLYTTSDALDSGGVGLLVGGWSLAAFFIVPAIVVLLVRCTARAIAAVLRNRIERRLYGRAYHQRAASVMSLIFTVGALAASFTGDYRQAGWVIAGIGWFVSAICANRRHEWITQYTPWLESEVEA